MNQSVFYKNEDVHEIPGYLQSTQEWFSRVITNKLDDYSNIQQMDPNGFCVAEEAARYIVSSPNLKPHERVQVYNQQYWWRLLKAMHENFPMVTRLFGYHAFNETIAIPYLLKCPPNHWSLNHLGSRLSKWIDSEYDARDKQLVSNAVDLDWSFMASFIAPKLPLLDLNTLINGNPENLLNYKFYLQPHLHLFKWNYDLFKFREKFLEKDVDYWTMNDFPSLPKGKTFHFVLYRTNSNDIGWLEISAGEYTLLEVFKKGSKIEDACEYLEQQSAEIYEEASNNLQKWLQNWVSYGWLTLDHFEDTE